MPNPNPDAVQQIRVHFVREPPYLKEMVLKATKEDYDVQYVLNIEKPKVDAPIEPQDVKPTERFEKNKKEIEDNAKSTLTEEKNDISKYRNDLNLSPEQIIEKSKKIIESIPNFFTKSEKEKSLIIADVINGKYDDVIFNILQENEKPSPTLNKHIQAYKISEKIV